MAGRQLALLRGINVGGKHCIPMAELVEVFSSLGCTEVTTYIQSGNVVFRPPAAGLRPEHAGAAIAERFGFAVPVVLRNQIDLARILANNPFPAAEINPKLLHVVFLAGPLSSTQVAALQAVAEGDEQLTALGRELYLSLPNGAGRSRLASACIAPKLPPTNTMRNWPTVLKLAELLAT
jgi:uncharacterized protein (DUF1697 family)